MNRYPLFSIRNLPAYMTILGVWCVLSGCFALLRKSLTGDTLAWASALLIMVGAVMSGMSIMFVASLINLRKLGPGFARLAQGASDPEIPPVWCPVLTLATRSAVELSNTVTARPDSTMPTASKRGEHT